MNPAAAVPRVTVELLTSLGACADQVERFADRWPDGVNVTIELCQAEARNADVSWDFRWAVSSLLSYEGRTSICLAYGADGESCRCPPDDLGFATEFAVAALRYGLRAPTT